MFTYCLHKKYLPFALHTVMSCTNRTFTHTKIQNIASIILSVTNHTAENTVYYLVIAKSDNTLINFLKHPHR